MLEQNKNDSLDKNQLTVHMVAKSDALQTISL